MHKMYISRMKRVVGYSQSIGYVLVVLVFLASCATTKEPEIKTISADDYPYINKFHDGVRLKAKGQIKEAIVLFEQCTLVKPNDDAVAYALAQCYLMLDQRQKAAEYTEKASKLDPKNVWYTQELAYMYFDQGKLDEASTCFKKMVASQPKNVDWLFGYAEVLKRQNKKEEAIANYDRMEDQLGILPDISIQKFELYSQLKQPEKALNELTKARRLYPDDPGILGNLIDYYFKQHEIDKAKEMLSELVRTNPSNGRAHLAIADINMREQNKTAAYISFKAAFLGEGVDLETKVGILAALNEQMVVPDNQLIELAQLTAEQYPEDSKAHAILGDLYLKNTQKVKALESYRIALKFDESRFATWNQVLMMEYQLQRFDELYKDARACSAIFPTISSVQLLYTTACVRIGNYVEAIEAADMGKEVVIDDKEMEAEFYALRGEALFRNNQPKDAIISFETALKKNPNNLVAKSTYAALLAEHVKDFVHANEMITQVLNLQPKLASHLHAKGQIVFFQGEYENAKKYLEEAVTLVPEDGNYAENLGDAYSKLNNLEKAIEYWNQAKKLGNNHKVLDKKILNKTYYAPVY